MSATKEFTYSDVSTHTSKKDLYLVIHDKIYDTTSFVDEHPYVPPPPQLLNSLFSLRDLHRVREGTKFSRAHIITTSITDQPSPQRR
jgi:hypothetical protein